MIYIDANVFVMASLNMEDEGENARSFLKDVQTGKIEASSSTLTLDELVWAVKKNRNLEDSIVAGEAFLSMSGLRLVVVSGDLLASALAIMKEYRLDPRDAIHVASAQSGGAKVIVSSDKHFDRLRHIKRKEVSDLVN